MVTHPQAKETPKRLRFAILCNGTTFYRFEAEAIRLLLDSQLAECICLVVDRSAAPHSVGTPRPFLRQFMPLRTAGYRLLKRLERRETRLNRATERVDLSALLSRCPVRPATVTTRGRYSQYFDDADLTYLKDLKLDFILRFGFNIIRGGIHAAARFGVWSYHHGDEQKYRGTPPGVWEIYRGDPLQGAVLQRLTDALDAGVILKKGYLPTIDHSIEKNYEHILNAAASWPLEVCRDILLSDHDYVNGPPSETQAPICRRPNNAQSAVLIWKLVRNTVRFAFNNRFRRSRWRIGVVDRPIHQVNQSAIDHETTWLPLPATDHVLADPFGVVVDGQVIVVAERAHLQSGHGDLVHMKSDDGNRFGPPEMMLPSPLHQSYPYLVEHGGTVYCLPECWESGEVAIYPARRFPDIWGPRHVLLPDFPGVDSTLFCHLGRWWLFTHRQGDFAVARLWIFHAESPLGPFTPHSTNPHKCDARSTRSAGTPYLHDGVLYRPTQDATGGYGGAVTVNRVTKLTPTTFREEPAQRLVAPRGSRPRATGLHHLAALGADRTLVDARTHCYRW